MYREVGLLESRCLDPGLSLLFIDERIHCRRLDEKIQIDDLDNICANAIVAITHDVQDFPCKPLFHVAEPVNNDPWHPSSPFLAFR